MKLRLVLTLWISFIYRINSVGPNIKRLSMPVSVCRVAMPLYSICWGHCIWIIHGPTATSKGYLGTIYFWTLFKECHNWWYQEILIYLKKRERKFLQPFRVGFYQKVPRHPSLSNDVYETYHRHETEQVAAENREAVRSDIDSGSIRKNTCRPMLYFYFIYDSTVSWLPTQISIS